MGRIASMVLCLGLSSCVLGSQSDDAFEVVLDGQSVETVPVMFFPTSSQYLIGFEGAEASVRFAVELGQGDERITGDIVNFGQTTGTVGNLDLIGFEGVIEWTVPDPARQFLESGIAVGIAEDVVLQFSGDGATARAHVDGEFSVRNERERQ